MDSISLLNGINTDYVNSLLKNTETAETDNTNAFSGILDAAKELLNNTNTQIEQAEQAEIDFALGKLTSTHELGVIQQKANLSLSYTVAIRDKLLEAYREIMQIQI